MGLCGSISHTWLAVLEPAVLDKCVDDCTWKGKLCWLASERTRMWRTISVEQWARHCFVLSGKPASSQFEKSQGLLRASWWKGIVRMCWSQLLRGLWAPWRSLGICARAAGNHDIVITVVCSQAGMPSTHQSRQPPAEILLQSGDSFVCEMF